MAESLPEKPSVTKSSLYPEQVTRVIIPERLDSVNTQHLYLRRLDKHDAADLFEFRSRQEVADWLWPKVPHKVIAESEEAIAKKIFETPDGSGTVGRQFHFAIIQKDDPKQKVIGAVGINSLVPAPSVGYGIHPDYWGRGYAAEAVRAVIDSWWQLDRIDGEDAEEERLYAACNKANIGSLKVLLKNGFQIEEEVPIEGDTVAVLALKRPC
ncbi:hypothetical protein POX_a01482 [Penicillium oxalicum]|uniref:N-acetyltransferase domain-containing protein n=1 Tax=Penicillium oxalicum (strain 114-2 / CGMCC 5302) TaxID=933388 RepID=S8BEM9_PENO1|nr:hypothetical protein POX_a01482 [Penicillium oxalicum]EPS33522.1 hypothetical protein PDE_08484 [Penicillium oxalicum 114-2]KAI2794881.1 hypothetical protein POX_a01482 [Penicillium oxalicum]